MKHKPTWKHIFTIAFTIVVGVFNMACSVQEQEPIKIGILHSQTGTLADSESPVADATLLAIAEINASGGILERKIEPILVDTRSDSAFAAEEAERLIVDEGVAAIFGCWTSACRKAVKPVVEKHNSLLIYPVQFEGMEESPNIVYIGSTPNQQIIPAVEWAFVNLGERFFLVGSDYIFPRAANEIIKDKVEKLGGEIVGEEYLILGSQDVEAIIQQIVSTKPDVILNTINGDSNVAFFQALSQAGVSAAEMPTVSFSIAEAELQSMNLADVAGHYAAWSYFQSIDSPANRDFVKNYQATYGANRVTSDPIEAGYIGVYLWADAVKNAQIIDAHLVISQMANQTISAPRGFVRVDSENQHLWQTIRIGQIESDGQFNIVWEPGILIPPLPFPKTRTKSDWEMYLEDLYRMWDGNWENLKQ